MAPVEDWCALPALLLIQERGSLAIHDALGGKLLAEVPAHDTWSGHWLLHLRSRAHRPVRLAPPRPGVNLIELLADVHRELLGRGRLRAWMVSDGTRISFFDAEGEPLLSLPPASSQRWMPGVFELRAQLEAIDSAEILAD